MHESHSNMESVDSLFDLRHHLLSNKPGVYTKFFGQIWRILSLIPIHFNVTVPILYISPPKKTNAPQSDVRDNSLHEFTYIMIYIYMIRNLYRIMYLKISMTQNWLNMRMNTMTQWPTPYDPIFDRHFFFARYRLSNG